MRPLGRPRIRVRRGERHSRRVRSSAGMRHLSGSQARTQLRCRAIRNKVHRRHPSAQPRFNYCLHGCQMRRTIGYPSVTELAKRYAFDLPQSNFGESWSNFTFQAIAPRARRRSPVRPTTMRNQFSATGSTIFDKSPITARSERDDLTLLPKAQRILGEDEERFHRSSAGHDGAPVCAFACRWPAGATTSRSPSAIIG